MTQQKDYKHGTNVSSEQLQKLHNQRQTHIEPYNPEWVNVYIQEYEKLRHIFTDKLKSIDHIGSTAIPGIKAKPIIDILITTEDINQIDSLTNQIEDLGYIAGGEFGLPGRRFFCKGDEKHCHIHVHIYEETHPSVPQYLKFRNYMIDHPDEMKKYELLKTKLAQKYSHNRTLYTAGKNEFIQKILHKAAEMSSEK